MSSASSEWFVLSSSIDSDSEDEDEEDDGDRGSSRALSKGKPVEGNRDGHPRRSSRVAFIAFFLFRLLDEQFGNG